MVQLSPYVDPPLGPTRLSDMSYPDADLSSTLKKIVAEIDQDVESWRETLMVGIGQARKLTGLKDTQIRYFESLGALQLTKNAEQQGASRLYDLQDLRRLKALALLLQSSYKPAEAAEIIKQHGAVVDQGLALPISELLVQESNSTVDGFLLVRLSSQLLFAFQQELKQIYGEDTRLKGCLLPTHQFAHGSDAEMRQYGAALCGNLRDTLIMLDRDAIIPAPTDGVPPTLFHTGDDSSTLLVYSCQNWELPQRETYQYTVYTPEDLPEFRLLLIIDAPDIIPIESTLNLRTPHRIQAVDMLLRLIELLRPALVQSAGPTPYSYRADGFQIAHTGAAYKRILQIIRTIIFPDDSDSMSCLLIPDHLDQPRSLSILSHDGYVDTLAAKAELDLTGARLGLSGRAYTLREPFFALHANSDKRVEYGLEENCQVALAIPLMTAWDQTPFGVLYLATRSKDPKHRLRSDAAYVALLIGNILGEMLGRWWLTRLRRERDNQFHQWIDQLVHWFDGMDQYSYDFERACERIEALWSQWGHTTGGGPDHRQRVLTFVVFDVDEYKERVQARHSNFFSFSAQNHVAEAIASVLPQVTPYWFKNDHTMLILDGMSSDKALDIVRRISGGVRALPLKVSPHAKDTTITVSAAIKEMSYQELSDLAGDDRTRLYKRLRTIFDDLRRQTRGVQDGRDNLSSIRLFTSSGWESIKTV